MEKWMQSKPNPYVNKKMVVTRKPLARNRIHQRPRPSMYAKHVAARMGTPIQLFKDSDRDGVPNVFDCKPHNKKKQDVMHPQNFGSGMGDMLSRQENARQQRAYNRMIKEMQRQDAQRLLELQRIQTPINQYTTREYTGGVTLRFTDEQFETLQKEKAIAEAKASSSGSYSYTVPQSGGSGKPMTVTVTNVTKTLSAPTTSHVISNTPRIVAAKVISNYKPVSKVVKTYNAVKRFFRRKK